MRHWQVGSLQRQVAFLILSGKEDGQPNSYHVSEGVDSYTDMTLAQKERWLGKGNAFVLVDTPGNTLILFYRDHF